MIGHVRKSSENLPQIRVGLDTSSATALHDRVNDGAAFSGLLCPYEKPVFLSDGSRPDRVLYEVMPPPDLCRVVA